LFRVKGKFDVIFVQQLSPVTVGLPGVWLKKKKKAKLYLWVLDLWPESFLALSNIKNKTLINLIYKIVKYIYNNTDVFFISSNSFKISILNNCDRVKPIYYLPNWAEDTKNTDIDISKLPKFPKGFNILFAGNIGDSQGLTEVLKAAKLANDINWIFVGDGRFLPYLKNQIQLEKLTNVFTFGRFPIESMGYFYKKADVMLVSLSNDPVFSMTVPAKIQSYMSHGKIILGILDGEGRDLINQLGIGVAVNAGDWSMLIEKAKYLKSLNSDQKLAIELKSRQEYINHFSKNEILNKLEKILLNKE
jgi:glycosyltransferase involved in cell wall biosynthesis